MLEKKNLKKLDAIRGFAALYVFLEHWSSSLYFIPEIVKKNILSFGQEAVIIFFIVSGFTIYFSCYTTLTLNFRGYFIKRFRRIYFPFLITVILSIFIFYTNGTLEKNFSLYELCGNILMLQDNAFLKPGTWVNPFLGNLPLWSLSYEWWFYMMFFPILNSAIFKSKYRIHIITIFSAISYLIYLAYPNQASLICSYFIIWWSGVELAHIYIHQQRFSFNRIKPILISLAVMITLTAVNVIVKKDFRLGYYPFLLFRNFGASFLIILLGWLWYRQKMRFFSQILGVFAILAPISYGLYVSHFTILLRWEWLNDNISNIWALNIVKIMLSFGLAYLVEIKLQPLVNRWLK